MELYVTQVALRSASGDEGAELRFIIEPVDKRVLIRRLITLPVAMDLLRTAACHVEVAIVFEG